MEIKCPLNEYYPPEEQTRGINYWGDCGTVVGWSKPIILSCPYPNLPLVGGWWLFKKDKDGSICGTDPKMITFCRECPKNCRKPQN